MYLPGKNLFCPDTLIKGSEGRGTRLPGPSEGSLLENFRQQGGILLADSRRNKPYRHPSRAMGKAYCVRDKKCWYLLPKDLRLAVYQGFHKAFHFLGAGRMTLQGIDEGQEPRQINFTDAFVRLYSDSNQAGAGLKANVLFQLAQVTGTTPYRDSFNPNDFKVATARTVTIKRVLKSGQCICITDSAVSLERVLGWWRYLSRNERKESKDAATAPTFEWLKSKASPDWRKWFGNCLGRVIAHEVMHQLYSGPKRGLLPHKSSGIGANGGGQNWWRRNDAFCKADQSRMLLWLNKLAKLQGHIKSVPINRTWVRK